MHIWKTNLKCVNYCFVDVFVYLDCVISALNHSKRIMKDMCKQAQSCFKNMLNRECISKLKSLKIAY